MKRKDIDAMREVRLWVGQIIIPAIMLTITIFPNSRIKIANWFSDLKDKFTKK